MAETLKEYKIILRVHYDVHCNMYSIDIRTIVHTRGILSIVVLSCSVLRYPNIDVHDFQ